MRDDNYFTFKTKEEVLNLIDQGTNKDAITTTIKTIAKVSVPIIPHFSFIPDLRIQTANCNLYSGYNCVASIGWQLQELFTLICERNGYDVRDDGENLDWFIGKDVDAIVIDDYPKYKVIAIGSASKDKWIKLDTWAKEVVAKHS